MSSYANYLVMKYYPTYWNRWTNIIEENYKRKNIKKQLKWDFYEYLYEGHWKNFNSLESRILNRKPNEEDIEYLAYLKGCTVDVAKKFYDKKCNCGKKLNPKETAMYFKIFGVNANTPLCKKCLCKTLDIKEAEYSEMSRKFMEQGCSLF